MIRHRNLVYYISNLKNIYNVSAAYMPFFTNICVDLTVTSIYFPLLSGGTIYTYSGSLLNNLESIVSNAELNLIKMTPTHLEILNSSIQPKPLRNIKIILGGENLSSHIIWTFQDKFGASTQIHNEYGPTETTVGCSDYLYNSEQEKFVPIGRPYQNTYLYIIDRYQNIVPIGATGELCIAGAGVGAGYLNRPELTAEKFVPNPFGTNKLYKTGDLAYWREDGNIVYVGRNDSQVKIRGLRIEMGEIENVLQEVHGVAQAAVVVRKNETGQQFICAFYTGQEISNEILRNAIKRKLPRYMVPRVFIHLETIPLMSSGKVNRKALPKVDLNNYSHPLEYRAPVTERERIVVNLVERVLHAERVGTQDNFFDLGGDSLKSIELSAALERINYHVSVKTIFECVTLAELAKRLTIVEMKQEVELPVAPIPATDAQVRVYIAQAMAGGTAYNVPYVFQVKHLNPAKLQTAVSQLVARHESLRTRFENKSGQTMQIVEDSVDCTVKALDNEDISVFVRPFNLATAPLLRVGYYQNTVMVDMHHIITDGGSMPVFLRELNELYMGRDLAKKPAQYREFAIRGHDYSQSEQYWLSVYSDEPPVLEMNTDYPRQNKQTFSGTTLYETLPGSLHAQICEKCRTIGITPYTFYMGAFYVLLSKFSGNEDIVVGVPASGRSGKFLDSIGMFVNTLALRGRPEGDKTTLAFFKEIKETTIQALDNQDYPYGELVKKLGIHTENRNPLFDVMFAYQSEEMTEVIFGDELAELLPIPVTTSKYDFTFNAMPRQDDVVLMVEYCIDLYEERTIRRLLEGYKLILTQMLDSGKRLRDIFAVTDSERQQLLYDFNDTATDYPKSMCIHQLFEEQAFKSPQHIALVFSDRSFSYEELNGLANGLAKQLKLKGIMRGDVVAVLAKRSYEIVVAILAVLKAGAAYLPIDSNYPVDRIETIIKDSNSKIILTYGVNYTGNNVLMLEENIVFCPENPENVNDVYDICAVIYTSGSTGKPKGTLLHHQGLVNYTYANDALYTHGTCVIGFSIYTFDAFFLDTICPMLRGISAVMATEDQQFQQFEFEQLIKKNSNCNLFITPAKLKLFLDNMIDNQFYEKIRNICIGGEVFPQEFVDIFTEDTKVFNVYGPTECSMWVLEFPIVGADIALGHPLANIQIYIVDKYSKPVPIGVTGELCIAGDCVGAGYLNRPELTAEKFIDNPFGEGKLYKTGDLAYWREDGNIVYVGRNDFQVKIRGLRIELGEIENALQLVEGISQTVVVVRKNETGRQFICAFYTGRDTDSKILRTAIGQKLPKYMLPHSFTHLEAMPLTTSGKVNRKALPEVDLSSLASTAEYVPPVGEIEKHLAIFMEQTLDYSPVGRNDDFFDLGGDSLKAIEFVSKAHNDGIYFSLQSIFDHPTVKALCEHIGSGDKPNVSYADEDFTVINNLLMKNCIEPANVPSKKEVGNLFLAGATGFLGIHILAEFLEHDNGIVYCLVRGDNQTACEKRFANLLDFYFDGKYADLLGGRIQVICGDLQKNNLGLTKQGYHDLQEQVDTVINTAASVKHYGSYQYFYAANVESTRRLIDFCMSAGIKLIHISTLSVSGNSFGDQFDGYISETEKHFYESSLYIGQPLENVYARSKFEAEKAVLEAMTLGLQANIMRMGNLTNRMSDGKFQVNHETNAFARRIKGVLELGMIPDYLLSKNMHVEFTPIDEAANAIMTIVRHFNMDQTVFHINSTKVAYLDQLIDFFCEFGCPLSAVSGADFTAALRKAAKQTGMEHIFETFVNDLDKDDQLNYDSNIHIENTFSEKYLHCLGFTWSEIGIEYLRKYAAYFRKIEYWEE